MKKLLLAISMLTLVGMANAQSNVAVYGLLDAGVYSLSKANGTKDAQGLADSTVASSFWGFKGSENLGQGQKAIFQVEGDVATNNGGTNTNGVFRRQAFVGLQGGYGEVTLGLRLNPATNAHNALLPVMGNSVNLGVLQAQGYFDTFTRNAITYTAPTANNLLVQVQYGMSNSVDKEDDGSTYSGRVEYKLSNLTVNLGYQNRKGNGTASSAMYGNSFKDKETSIIGAKYKLGNIEVGTGFVTNRIANGTKVGNVDVTLLGVGYTVSPAVTLGANYVKNNDNASLTNVQARYAFSKRTMGYVQYGLADNGNTSNPFRPVFMNTNSSPADNIAGYTSAANSKQSALGVGLVHTF